MAPNPGSGPDQDPRGDREAARARRRRALEEPLDVRPRGWLGIARFEVRNPTHQTRYWVFLASFPDPDGALCDCPDYGRRGIGTCKHIEAVRLWLTEHPEEEITGVPVTTDRPTWERIERAIADQGARALDPRGLRSPGELLFVGGAGPDRRPSDPERPRRSAPPSSTSREPP